MYRPLQYFCDAPSKHRNFKVFVFITSLLWTNVSYTAPVTSSGKVPEEVTGQHTREITDANTPEAAAFREGLSAQMRGKPAVAKERFNHALEINKGYVPALIGLAGLAQKDGRQDEALRLLKQAQSSQPNSANVHLALGRYYFGRGKLADAEFSFRQAVTLLPKASAPLIALGELYLQQDSRHGDALKAMQLACELDPQNRFAQYLRGIAAAANGQRQIAIGAFEIAAKLAPKDPAPSRAMGRLYLETNTIDKAILAFDEALARQPTFVPAMLDRADALGRGKRWDDALTQLAKAEKLAPKMAEIALAQGDVLQSTKRWNEALSQYARAVNLNPNLPTLRNNYALALLGAGQAAKAVESANLAVKSMPNSAPFLDTLGWVQRGAGDLASSRKSAKKAIDIEPTVAVFQYHYGVVLADLKETGPAIEALKIALVLDPAMEDAADANLRLKVLEASK